MRFRAILNRDGGALRSLDADAVGARIADAFDDAGRIAEACVVEGGELMDALAAAADDASLDGVIIGGGDGSVSAAAATAWRSGKAIGVLPAGTMNLFARSLGLPLDIDAAIPALATAEARQVDIGLANGRPFVHQYSVGLHARIIRAREGAPYRSRMGKMWASLSALGREIAREHTVRAEIRADDTRMRGRYAWLAVSNNPYGEGHLPYADGLERGVLGLYRAGRLTRAAAVRLAADLTVGTWNANPKLRTAVARRVEIAFERLDRGDRASLDGELIPLEAKVEVEIRPGALRALVPAAPQ